MRSLPVRDHWCASFHLATVLAAVGHRSCGRGVCVWCARRSRLRGVDPKPGVRQAPRRQGRGLPPRGLSPGVAHWGKHPEAHTKSTPRSPHRASLFKAAGNHQQPTGNNQPQPQQCNRRQLGSDHAPRSPALAMRQAQPTAGVSMATTHPHRGSTADTNPAHNAGTPATSHNLVARAENPNAGVCGRATRGVQRRGIWHLSKRPPGRLAR